MKRSKKKTAVILAVVLAAMTLIPSSVQAAQLYKNSFSDVKQGTWYYGYVMEVAETGLLKGHDNGKFAPNDNLTRAQFAEILRRVQGSPVVSYNGRFADVKGSEWYTSAVAWSSTYGVINGYDARHFGPEDDITREQIAVILRNYAANVRHYSVSAQASLSSYTDRTKISSWAADAMKWCVAQGFISGKGNGILDPQGKTTRAECAAIIMRFCKQYDLVTFPNYDLSFMDKGFTMYSKSNSAPYVQFTDFWEREKPYLAFTTDWRCDLDAENTYYNVHSWYKADDLNYNGIRPGSGYTGFQNVNGGHIAILSLWSAQGYAPTVEYIKKGGRAEPFYGEGTGTKVLIPYDWRVGKWYTNIIQTRNENGKTYYDLFVRPEGGDWELLATLSIALPNLGLASDTAFLEDFTYNGLERADSFRNMTATTGDMQVISPQYLSLYEFNNKMFDIANQSLKCTYSYSNGVLSLRSSGKNLTTYSMFPQQLSY